MLSAPPRRLLLALLAVVVVAASPRTAARAPVAIQIDAGRSLGPMTTMWAFFGYDEPNYTYMTDGRALLSELAALAPAPVFVRVHNLLTSGDGSPGLKWGSTNAYTEDADGRPVYDWRIVDRIFDTLVERKMKPIVEIGFMPEALSTRPVPYRHDWVPGADYGRIYTGWTYPPKDYDKWRELVFQWARHSVERYGRREVESWYWEVWNEPDIGYWHGSVDDYLRLYDFAADGLRRALPRARIGGPTVTGPNGPRPQQFLRDFLEHCLRGRNAATGGIGAPLDYVTFHAKGSPRVVDGHVRMGISSQLKAIANGFEIVASFPELRSMPIILGESDPEGCAACSVRTNPENAYRNGTVYSSYTAAQIARTFELADAYGVNLRGAVTWAFEFEGQPFFAGFRDLATNGIDKPVLNVFRMLGMMRGNRLTVVSSGAPPLEDIREAGVRGEPDINALASRSGRDIRVLVWNYHDDDVAAPAADVEVTVAGVPDGRPLVTEYRIDSTHSNAYDAWKRAGAPQPPAAALAAALRQAGRLQVQGQPAPVATAAGRLRLRLTLPRQAVSLLVIHY
ncbi:MAG: beta-xylosidase [Acidobacteriota bacterium]